MMIEQAMSNQYILIGQTPVPEPDLLTWARWFEKNDRHVAVTRVLDVAVVSTVFWGSITISFPGAGASLCCLRPWFSGKGRAPRSRTAAAPGGRQNSCMLIG